MGSDGGTLAVGLERLCACANYAQPMTKQLPSHEDLRAILTMEAAGIENGPQRQNVVPAFDLVRQSQGLWWTNTTRRITESRFSTTLL